MFRLVSIGLVALGLLALGGCAVPTNADSLQASARALAAGYSSLLAKANNQYVCADNAGTSPLVANRGTVNDWESFLVVTNGDGTLSFQSKANGLWVAADLNQGAKLIARSASIGTWEKFQKVSQSDGSIALRALANNLYVSADLNVGAVLVADRPAVGGWETFVLTTAPISVNPDLGPNVVIFDPGMPAATIQNRVDSIFAEMESNQFGSQRYALLFKPGTYNVNVNVGFYTQVAGLGHLPGGVLINGAVHAEADWFQGNATQNFWRSAENLSVAPSGGTDRWAVSQAAPYRRMHLKGNLLLDDGGWSSGGYLADTKVDGTINSGGQQQWISRNAQIGSWTGSNWNMVFVGVEGAPSGSSWPNPPNTVLTQAPLIREKPFLTVDGSGSWGVFVPGLRSNASGTSWASGAPAGSTLPLSQFHIAQAGRDTAAAMNAALASGKHLLLTPGVYHLSEALRITAPNTIVLGLGLATLVPDGGVKAMTVADVDGVKIAGVLFDAGTVSSPVLLEVGTPGSTASHSANPTSLHDLFFRIGGATVGKAAVSLAIHSSHVIGDHFWIWRADHGNPGTVGWTTNTAANGLVVNGASVTIYGLFVEHYQQYQTLWNGNNGRVYFYQSEIPYDPPNQASYQNGSTNGWASYKVADSVTSHQVWGAGVYCYFNVNPSVKLENAIEVPNSGLNGAMFHAMTTVSLGGTGEITHVINGWGGTANASNQVVRLYQ